MYTCIYIYVYMYMNMCVCVCLNYDTHTDAHPHTECLLDQRPVVRYNEFFVTIYIYVCV